jgi:hypothetical protein
MHGVHVLCRYIRVPTLHGSVARAASRACLCDQDGPIPPLWQMFWVLLKVPRASDNSMVKSNSSASSRYSLVHHWNFKRHSFKELTRFLCLDGFDVISTKTSRYIFSSVHAHFQAAFRIIAFDIGPRIRALEQSHVVQNRKVHSERHTVQDLGEKLGLLGNWTTGPVPIVVWHHRNIVVELRTGLLIVMMDRLICLHYCLVNKYLLEKPGNASVQSCKTHSCFDPCENSFQFSILACRSPSNVDTGQLADRIGVRCEIHPARHP